MRSFNFPYSPLAIRNGFTIAVGIGLALILFGRILVPATGLLGIGAALAILLIYGLLGYFGTPNLYHRNPQLPSIALVFGLVAGVIFIGEMIWEYTVLPANNTTLGLIEFGTVFGLYFLSGFIVAYRTQQLRQAVLTAVGSAMLGSLIWLIGVLSIFYLFRGSPQQTLVFHAEGNYEDFARSGMSNFDAFIMEDFMGAAFFHLLLGPMVAAILGTLGGLIGKVIRRLQKR